MAEKRRWWQRRKHPAKLTTPDGLPAVTLPPGYVEALALYGLRGSYGYIYRTQPNVRSVIDFFAEQVSGVKLKHYAKVPMGATSPSGRLELETSDLQRLLDRPAPGITRTRLWRDTVGDIGVYDIAYWRKIRLEGRVRAIVRVPPTSLVPFRDRATLRILYYTTTLGDRIAVEDLVVFPGYDPEQMQGFVSPLETLRRVLAEEYAAGVNMEHKWRNASRRDGVVERPATAPVWDDAQREAWRLEWEGIMSGASNAGRVALLEDDMKWRDSAFSPEEMEYLEARKLSRMECAAAFRIDPRLVFAHDQPVTTDIRTGFYTDRLVPFLTRLAEEVDDQLLPEFEPFDNENQYTEFNIGEKLRGSFIDEAKVASSVVGGPTVKVNEWRARWNLPPDPQGDQLFIPLNSVRGGGPQASPQAPIETPGEQPAGITPGGGTSPPNEAAKAWYEAEQKAWYQAEKTWRRAARLEAVRSHLTRQERVVASVAGAIRKWGSVTAEDLWIDAERWDRELAQDFERIGGNGSSSELAYSVNELTRDALSEVLGMGGDVRLGFVQARMVVEQVLNGGSG